MQNQDGFDHLPGVRPRLMLTVEGVSVGSFPGAWSAVDLHDKCSEACHKYTQLLKRELDIKLSAEMPAFCDHARRAASTGGLDRRVANNP